MKKKTGMLAALLVLLLLAAWVGYDRFTKNYKPETVAPEQTEKTQITETETEKTLPVLETADTGSADPEKEQGSGNEPQEQENPQMEFEVRDAEGNTVKLSDFRGKPVILNFWATWCGPCQSELPAFDRAYAEYGDRVSFLMVDLTDGVRETKEKVQETIEQNGYTFPVFYDTMGDASDAFGIYSIPMTFALDQNGIPVYQYLGTMPEESLTGMIEDLLAVTESQ